MEAARNAPRAGSSGEEVRLVHAMTAALPRPSEQAARLVGLALEAHVPRVVTKAVPHCVKQRDRDLGRRLPCPVLGCVEGDARVVRVDVVVRRDIALGRRPGRCCCGRHGRHIDSTIAALVDSRNAHATARSVIRKRSMMRSSISRYGSLFYAVMAFNAACGDDDTGGGGSGGNGAAGGGGSAGASEGGALEVGQGGAGGGAAIEPAVVFRSRVAADNRSSLY